MTDKRLPGNDAVESENAKTFDMTELTNHLHLCKLGKRHFPSFKYSKC